MSRTGRKNLKRASQNEVMMSLQEGQSIMKVVSLRGSNLIEVLNSGGKTSLALFPAKFQKSMWIKRGSFVVVDERGRDKALESGSKVACIVEQVLFFEQVRQLQRSPEWPEIFKAATVDDTSGHLESSTVQRKQELGSSDDSDSDDDGLPPLEANLNRIRPRELCSDSEIGSDSDS